MSLLLDTHVWIWWITGQAELSSRERTALDEYADRKAPAISAISIWEAQMLVSHRRLFPKEPFEAWIRRMTSPDTVRLLPLDADVVVALHDLPRRFHGDPADRLIVATARVHKQVLATHDFRIRRSRLVPIWKA